MTDNRVYVIRNITHQTCLTCGSRHEFVSRKSQHARCGAPVAFSKDKAEQFVSSLGWDLDDSVLVAPDDTVVVLDDSARKLRQQGGGTVPLDQVFTGLRTM